jgi:hypothetical protein
MKSTIFDGANLCVSNFFMCNLYKASFNGVDLRSTKINASICFKSNFNYSLMSRSQEADIVNDPIKDTYFGTSFNYSQGNVYIDSTYVDRLYNGFRPIEQIYYPDSSEFKNYIDTLKKLTYSDIQRESGLLFDKFNDNGIYWLSDSIVLEMTNGMQNAFKVDLSDLCRKSVKSLERNYSNYASRNIFANSNIRVWEGSPSTFAVKRDSAFRNGTWISGSLKERCLSIDIFNQALNDRDHIE